MRIEVVTARCTGCEQCIESCPYTSIVIKDGKAFINEYCQFCRTCLSICPEGAIIEIAEEGDDTQKSEVRSHKSEYKGVWVFAEQGMARSFQWPMNSLAPAEGLPMN